MSRRFTAFLALLTLPLAFCVAGTSPAVASAQATTVTASASARLDKSLGALWSTVLETPSARNPFGTGGEAYQCLNIGKHTIAPFGPKGVASCTVAPGTTLFVVASSFECSTFEGEAKPDLRSCAIEGDVKTAPTVTVDGTPVSVTEAESGLLPITLPADNIFVGQPANTEGFSYAHGWVALLRPLKKGTHTIVITTGSNVVTTTITVR